MKKLLLLALLTLAACGANTEPPATVTTTQDRLGNPITIPENVETIVSLTPAITQLLDDLGAGDRIVAIDTWTADQIPGFETLPQLDMMIPDLELILSLAPDLVLAGEISFGMDADIFQTLIDAGITVAQIPTSTSIAAIMEDNQFVADTVGLTEAGQAINEDMQTQIDWISQLAQQVETPKRVLFEISPSPDIFSFGQGTFLNEMLELIHAENIFADETSWIGVSDETAIAANPDVILTNVAFLTDPVAEILGRTGWEHVTAIENQAVFYVDNAATSLPNHRIVGGLKEMAQAIYPEIFGDFKD